MKDKKTKEPQLVKPLVAILYNPTYDNVYDNAVNLIIKKYGSIDFVSKDFPLI